MFRRRHGSQKALLLLLVSLYFNLLWYLALEQLSTVIYLCALL